MIRDGRTVPWRRRKRDRGKKRSWLGRHAAGLGEIAGPLGAWGAAGQRLVGGLVGGLVGSPAVWSAGVSGCKQHAARLSGREWQGVYIHRWAIYASGHLGSWVAIEEMKQILLPTLNSGDVAVRSSFAIAGPQWFSEWGPLSPPPPIGSTQLITPNIDAGLVIKLDGI